MNNIEKEAVMPMMTAIEIINDNVSIENSPKKYLHSSLNILQLCKYLDAKVNLEQY